MIGHVVCEGALGVVGVCWEIRGERGHDREVTVCHAMERRSRRPTHYFVALPDIGMIK